MELKETLKIETETSSVGKGEIRNELKKTIEIETCTMIKFQLKLNNKHLKCISWSKNLQSSRGLTNEMRNMIGNWVKDHLK
jgi:hypothetical protein